MHKALLVWDIDGTILMGTSGRRAIRRLCAEMFGIPDADQDVVFAGKNDRQLFREILHSRGIASFDLEQVLQRFQELFAEEFSRDPGQLYPGVSEVLAGLDATGLYAMALGTGNLERNARLKLEPHGLNRYFAVGGFADDSDIRAEIIRAGIRRAEEHYDTTFDRVVVIGDTPMDVECGKANGARTLGLGQLRYTAQELAACGADAVLPSFADVPVAVAAIHRLATE